MSQLSTSANRTQFRMCFAQSSASDLSRPTLEFAEKLPRKTIDNVFSEV